MSRSLDDIDKLSVENEKKEVEEFEREYGSAGECTNCGNLFRWDELYSKRQDARMYCIVCIRESGSQANG